MSETTAHICLILLKSPAVAALIAGTFGVGAVWLGLGRFRSERWWEKKAAAYSAVIEALHVIDDVETERVTAIEKSIDLPIERVDKLRLSSVTARAEIRKFANLGGFIITEDAAKVLSDLTDFLERAPRDNLHAYYDERAAFAAKAITEVKKAAKRDLHT